MCTPPRSSRDARSKKDPLFLPDSPNNEQTDVESPGPFTEQVGDSGLFGNDEPFTVNLDMFELVDSGADDPESMSTAVVTNSIPNAEDSQAHGDRSSTARGEDEHSKPIATGEKQVHWQDEESDEDMFATALEELEAWVQSGAVEIIPDN